jgi:hypothetical protein
VRVDDVVSKIRQALAPGLPHGGRRTQLGIPRAGVGLGGGACPMLHITSPYAFRPLVSCVYGILPTQIGWGGQTGIWIRSS